jgi:hypothetical protein
LLGAIFVIQTNSLVFTGALEKGCFRSHCFKHDKL